MQTIMNYYLYTVELSLCDTHTYLLFIIYVLFNIYYLLFVMYLFVIFVLILTGNLITSLGKCKLHNFVYRYKVVITAYSML